VVNTGMADLAASLVSGSRLSGDQAVAKICGESACMTGAAAVRAVMPGRSSKPAPNSPDHRRAAGSDELPAPATARRALVTVMSIHDS